MILSCVFSILMSALDNTGESPTQVDNKITVPVNNVFTVKKHSSSLCLSNCRQTHWSTSSFSTHPHISSQCTLHLPLDNMVLGASALPSCWYTLVNRFICTYQQKHLCFLPLLQQLVWYLSSFCKVALLAEEKKRSAALVRNWC